MAIKAEPSGNYPIILVPEDSRAFPDHRSAIRELRKQWAAQAPADRTGYFIARVESFVEPDYEVAHHEELVPGLEGPPVEEAAVPRLEEAPVPRPRTGR
jgi:hypothetical protein